MRKSRTRPEARARADESLATCASNEREQTFQFISAQLRREKQQQTRGHQSPFSVTRRQYLAIAQRSPLSHFEKGAFFSN